MKKFKKYSEGLYKAYKNAEVTEYPGIHEYLFSYNNSNYLLVIAESTTNVRVKFGETETPTSYFNNKNAIKVDVETISDVEETVRNIFNYYIKYKLEDPEIIDEVVNEAIRVFTEH